MAKLTVFFIAFLEWYRHLSIVLSSLTDETFRSAASSKDGYWVF